MEDINKHATLYVKMFILLCGALLVLIGIGGLVIDYMSSFNIHSGNSGWALVAAGVVLMAVSAALYIVLPAMRERSRLNALRLQYAKHMEAIKPEHDVEVSALVHRIKENAMVLGVRTEMLVAAAEACKKPVEPVDRWHGACIKNMEDAVNDAKLAEQYAHTVVVLTESLNNYIKTGQAPK